MATYLIRHSPVLSGEVEVHAAKNAVLPLLAAGLADGGTTGIEGSATHHGCGNASDHLAGLRRAGDTQRNGGLRLRPAAPKPAS